MLKVLQKLQPLQHNVKCALPIISTLGRNQHNDSSGSSNGIGNIGNIIALGGISIFTKNASCDDNNPKTYKVKEPNKSMTPPPKKGFFSSLFSSDSTVQVRKPQFQYNKDDKIFLVFGETGCGKSTFINTLTNYFRDGSLENLKVMIPTKYLKGTEKESSQNTEFNVNDTTKAQTKDATAYKLTNSQKKICIIDTPGLNDTEGLEQDDKNLNTILNAAINAPHLSGIVLVINGSSARLTHNIKSMINKLKGSLPDTMMDNIIVVFTMCRENTCNFKDISQLGIKPKEIFYINNTAFSSDPAFWIDDDKELLSIEWDKSMSVCDKIVDVLSSIKPIATEEFLKIKKLRSAIKSHLHEIRTELINLQNVMESINALNTDIKLAEETANQNQNFTVKKTITVTKMIETDYHSTICSQCNTICHQNCGLEFNSSAGSYFERCYCMQGGSQCTVCEGHCPATAHYHDKKGIEQTTEEVDEIVEQIQKLYLAGLDEADKKNAELNTQTLLKNSIDSLVKGYMGDIELKCNELKSICSHFNIVDELNDLIYMLKQESKNLTSVQARELADDTVKQVSEICDKFKDK